MSFERLAMGLEGYEFVTDLVLAHLNGARASTYRQCDADVFLNVKIRLYKHRV